MRGKRQFILSLIGFTAKRVFLYLHLPTKDNHKRAGRIDAEPTAGQELLSAPRFEVLWAAVSISLVSPLFPRRRLRQHRKKSLENRRFWKLRRRIPASGPKKRRRNSYLPKTVKPLARAALPSAAKRAGVRQQPRRLIPATKSDSAIPPNLPFTASPGSSYTGANLPVFPFSVSCPTLRNNRHNGDTRPPRRSVAPLRLLRSIAGLITALAFRAFYGLPVTAPFASILGVF